MAMNKELLEKKLNTITSDLLKEKGYISCVDVFIKMGYLSLEDYENWRFKRVPYLEKVINVNLTKISFIMKSIRRNSHNGRLQESRTAYKSWGKSKKIDLRFSKSGDPNIEQTYASHFLKPKSMAYRDREEPHSSPLPHHAAYWSVRKWGQVYV